MKESDIDTNTQSENTINSSEDYQQNFISETSGEIEEIDQDKIQIKK